MLSMDSVLMLFLCHQLLAVFCDANFSCCFCTVNLQLYYAIGLSVYYLLKSY